jgi:hypothetical protein
MTLELSFELSELVAAYTKAAQSPGNYPSPEHAGLAAALALVTTEARYAIARDLNRYDHRSLYEFAASVDYAVQLRNSEGVSYNQNKSEAPEAPCQDNSHPKSTVSESASALPLSSSHGVKPAEKLPEASTSPNAPSTPGASVQQSRELCTASSKT